LRIAKYISSKNGMLNLNCKTIFRCFENGCLIYNRTFQDGYFCFSDIQQTTFGEWIDNFEINNKKYNKIQVL
jgi:hypothetical protein